MHFMIISLNYTQIHFGLFLHSYLAMPEAMFQVSLFHVKKLPKAGISQAFPCA